ncbi:hypothetical protein [Nostoc sp.]|uniref:hypothetical protein n=1 Tax=Nostoc sp. TaxID=1180 RepID=UPI002FFD3076
MESTLFSSLSTNEEANLSGGKRQNVGNASANGGNANGYGGAAGNGSINVLTLNDASGNGGTGGNGGTANGGGNGSIITQL